jgi:hypothetical protein
VILLLIVGVLLIGAIGIQLWYWRNASSLGVKLPWILKAIMAVNISVLTLALFGIAWVGYAAVASGEM